MKANTRAFLKLKRLAYTLDPAESPTVATMRISASLLISGTMLVAVVLPLAAEAQVLDTLDVASDSTGYAVETYFVRADTASFFKPHGDEEKVEDLINRVNRGRCRATTVVRAANQKRAAELAECYNGEAINTRLIIQCAEFSQGLGTGDD